VQTLFIIHNSECRRKTSIISRSDIPLLPPTTLNPYYKSAFRIQELQRRAAPFTFCNPLFIIFAKEFLKGKFVEEKSVQSNFIRSKFQSLIAGAFSLIKIFSSYHFYCFPAKRNQNELKCNNKIKIPFLALKQIQSDSI